MDNRMDELEIKQIIEKYYDIDVEGIKKVKGSYKVISGPKTYCLKILQYELAHSYFIISAMKYLLDSGFSDVLPFIKTKEKNDFILMNNKYAYMTEWVNARLSNFDNPIELSIVSNELAKIHTHSEGFMIRKNMKPRIGWFSWIDVFNTRKNEILDFEKRINQKAYKSDFDKLYLDNVYSEVKRAEKSIEGLKKNKYIDVMERDVFNGGFCHHDFAHHNILVGRDGKLNIIDFDYCILDSHIHDLSSLLIRAMKDGKWDNRKADVIFYSYEKEKEVERMKLPLIREFMRFPQSFWQIGLQMYWEQQPWDDQFFINKLNRYLSDAKDRECFIDDYFKGGD